MPKFGLKKNLLMKNVVSEDGEQVTDHIFIVVENHTRIDPDLRNGEMIIAEGIVYKYKKHNGSKKMLTDFSLIGLNIKRYDKI